MSERHKCGIPRGFYHEDVLHRRLSVHGLHFPAAGSVFHRMGMSVCFECTIAYLWCGAAELFPELPEKER